MGSTSETSCFSPVKKTMGPDSVARVLRRPGGRSGGGQCFCALGSDTGGKAFGTAPGAEPPASSHLWPGGAQIRADCLCFILGPGLATGPGCAGTAAVLGFASCGRDPRDMTSRDEARLSVRRNRCADMKIGNSRPRIWTWRQRRSGPVCRPRRLCLKPRAKQGDGAGQRW